MNWLQDMIIYSTYKTSCSCQLIPRLILLPPGALCVSASKRETIGAPAGISMKRIYIRIYMSIYTVQDCQFILYRTVTRAIIYRMLNIHCFVHYKYRWQHKQLETCTVHSAAAEIMKYTYIQHLLLGICCLNITT